MVPIETLPRAEGSGPGGGQDPRRTGVMDRALKPHGHSPVLRQTRWQWPKQKPRSGSKGRGSGLAKGLLGGDSLWGVAPAGVNYERPWNQGPRTSRS